MIAERPTPKFPLGQTVATPGVLEALGEAGQSPGEFLARHAAGDWGIVDDGDARVNDEALVHSERVFSVYETALGVTIWIITEADRSATTILVPSEY